MQLTMRVKWMGRQFDRKFEAHRYHRLSEAGKFLENEIRRLITVTRGSYSPPYHSDPGEYPFVITHDLEKSYQTIVDRKAMIAYIGSDRVEARYLEQGTSIMKPRPYIRRTFWSRRKPIARIMAYPIR